MSASQPPQNNKNERTQKTMKERLEKLFSGDEPLAHASVKDLEAMKARIEELESQLAEKTKQAEIPHLESAAVQAVWENNDADQERRALNARRILLLFVGAIAISLPFYAYVIMQGAGWQIYVIVAGLLVVGALGVAGFPLIRRGRTEAAMGLMVASACVLIPLIVGLIAGVGLVLAATQFAVAYVISQQTLRGARASRTLLLGLIVSLLTLSLDLLAGWERLSFPALQEVINRIAVVLVTTLAVFAAIQFNNYKLRAKLAVGFTIVALISIGALGFVANRIATTQFNRQIGARFFELASRTAQATADTVVKNKIALEGLALNKFIQDGVEAANRRGTPDLFALEEIDRRWRAASDDDQLIVETLNNELAFELREFQSRLPQYAELFITDKYGALLASTNRTTDYYQADEAWWQTAWNNEQGGIYISQPVFDESAGVYAIDIALPIPAHNRKEYVGVLRATVNINELKNAFSALQLGESGQAVILLPDGQYLSGDLNAGPDAMDAETLSHLEALQGPYGLFAYQGVESLVSKAPVQSAHSQDADLIAALDWAVVVHQDLSEAYLPIANATQSILLTAIGILVLTGFLSVFIGNQLANPIESLTLVAQQAAQGNLLAKASERSQDEIGVLAATFNRMTSQLHETLTNLEQRVADRTYDLELAAEVGRAVSEGTGNLSNLLAKAVETIRARFNLYYTQIYLVNPSENNLILRAGTGEAGAQLLRRAHRLTIGTTSLNGRAALERRPMLVGDTKTNPNFLPNPLLPHTRSELCVPLIANDTVVGVLDMQSDKTNAFTETNLPAFQVLAGQLAIAIQNAALLEETEEARREVEQRASRLTASGWQDFLNAVDKAEQIGFVYRQEKIAPLDESPETHPPAGEAISAPISILGAAIGEIRLAHEEKTWTERELEILQAVSSQLAQHLENLRLLEQAERYRRQAEDAARLLTREGWEQYLQTKPSVLGAAYDRNQVRLLDQLELNRNQAACSHPLKVRDEVIGELTASEPASLPEDEAQELIAQVTENLSAHIENLRLLEQAEINRLETQKSQEQYALAVDGANDGIWDWNILTNEVYFSPRWKSMIGYEESELNDGFADFERLLHPEDHDRVLAAVDDYLSGRLDIYDVEFRFRHKDGSYRWIRARGKALRHADGTPYRMAGSHTDITEQKTAEAALAQRANQLETVSTVSTAASTLLNPDELLQTVVNLTKERFNLYHVQIYLLDENWSTLLLAAGSGEIGKQLVEIGHAIQLNLERSLVARAARERQAIIANDARQETDFLPNPLLPETASEMTIPMIAGDKVLGVFDVQSNFAGSFTAEDAQIYATLAAQTAVALQNARLYQEQSAMVVQLRELDRLKSSFLANMSHELRTPLNSILGFADVMLEGLDGPLTPNMDNDLRLIQKNGQHLLHLINDVLDMAKIESGKLNLIIESFNLHEILEEVTSITAPLASEKNLALFIDPNSDRDVTVTADRTRLRQVLINLVNNAMKFTERGKIAIRAVRETNNVLISVKDTGIGIPPSELETIFQEFTQVDSSTTRKVGGTGLGLPISRRLIEMHGGRLWAESSGVEGEGSVFYIFLPLEAKIKESEPVMKA